MFHGPPTAQHRPSHWLSFHGFPLETKAGTPPSVVSRHLGRISQFSDGDFTNEAWDWNTVDMNFNNQKWVTSWDETFSINNWNYIYIYIYIIIYIIIIYIYVTWISGRGDWPSKHEDKEPFHNLHMEPQFNGQKFVVSGAIRDEIDDGFLVARLKRSLIYSKPRTDRKVILIE